MSRNLLTSVLPLLKSFAPNAAGRFTALQSTMAAEKIEAEAGAGLVKVTMNGAGKLLSLRIDPSLLSPGKSQVAEDLTAAAVNEAIEKANAAQNRHTDKLLREIMEEMMKSEAFKNPFAMFGKKDKS